LAWLWDTLTGPVLTALGHTTTPADGRPWPRVWWCPVGILAYLPLHAAGHHHDLADGRAHPRAVLDRVVSTYTTTVRGLAYAHAQYPDPARSTTLIVAVPDAPGTPPLPGATAEANALAALIPGAHLLTHPTRGTVLAALPSHRVAHFACHGYVDWDNPAASQLVLYDHHTTPLTVADVSARQLAGSLAYLSACDTTVTNPALTNEAVHITGAFHLAGYQHVIGTLWPINDTVARDLACDVYTHLTQHGTTSPDTSRTAQALHDAIRRLRARYPATPTLWAPHTHTGT
jgi:CHAT domain-containing protein